MKKNTYLLFYLWLVITPLACFASPNANDNSEIILNSPRETFKVFRSAMYKVSLGDYSEQPIAIKCISNTEDKGHNESWLFNEAMKLYTVLKALDYYLEEIPDNVNTTKTTVTIGTDDIKFPFDMLKDKNGNWVFAEDNFHKHKFNEIYLNKIEATKQYTSTNMAGDTYVKHMSSPAQSYSTFINGVENKYGYTMNDALQVLSLDSIPEFLQKPLGRYYAIMIYRILKNQKKNSISSLSDDPSYPFPILFATFKNGHIAMRSIAIDEKANLKAWKFTPKTTANIIESYCEFFYKKNKILPLDIKGVPLLFYISDFLYEHCFHTKHFLFTTKFLGMRLWGWVFLVVMILITPPIVFCIFSLLIKPVIVNVINHLLLKTHRNNLAFSFILPMKFLSLFLVYHYLMYNLIVNIRYLEIGFFILDVSILLLTIWLSWITLNLIHELFLSYLGKNNKLKKTQTDIAVFMICRLFQVLISLACFFKLIYILGFDSMQLLTTMGIGALVIALAGKDTLENLFGTILITLEKSFKHGDWIKINNIEGTVEHVGLRSTRIRTFYDSYLTIPNSKFIINHIDNMGERLSRRFKTNLYLEYSTTAKESKAFTEGIQNIIMNTKNLFIIFLVAMQ